MTNTMGGLTQSCQFCARARDLLGQLTSLCHENDDKLVNLRLFAENSAGEVFEVACMRLACKACDNRGRVLTNDGKSLLDFLREFSASPPDPTKKREIPF